MIKESIHQKEIVIVNIYAPNILAPKYIGQILTGLERAIDNNMVKLEDFHPPLHLWTHHPDRKAIRKQWSATTLQSTWT